MNSKDVEMEFFEELELSSLDKNKLEYLYWY